MSSPSERSRESHRSWMAAALNVHRYPARRGTAPTYPDSFAAEFGDEDEAMPGFDYLPDPVVNNGHLVFGASLTLAPPRRWPSSRP